MKLSSFLTGPLHLWRFFPTPDCPTFKVGPSRDEPGQQEEEPCLHKKVSGPRSASLASRALWRPSGQSGPSLHRVINEAALQKKASLAVRSGLSITRPKSRTIMIMSTKRKKRARVNRTKVPKCHWLSSDLKSDRAMVVNSELS